MDTKIRMPDDFHVHLRQGPLMRSVVRDSVPWFGRMLVMPNIDPPVLSPADLVHYRAEIEAAVSGPHRPEFLMTFKVTEQVDPALVGPLKQAGAIGGKLYPKGVTTNSEDGVTEIEQLFPLFAAMEEHDVVLEIHAELPESFVLDREADYLPVVEMLAARYPALRIVVEHVSTRRAIETVRACPDTVAATVTVHHLMLTLDNVIGGMLEPHHFCKPIAKRPEDLRAIQDVVFAGDRNFFFGSDSAPHPQSQKEAACGCAGIYTAPVAIPLLAELFSSAGVPLTEEQAGPDSASLERFTSRLGSRFYGLPLQRRSITLAEERWTVPPSYGGVVPFRAGNELSYRLK